MIQDRPRVAILTDYFLHPENGAFLATNENLLLLQLCRFLREDLGWTAHVFQSSPLPERRLGGLPVLGIDAAPDRNGMYPMLNFAFARAGLDYDLRIYHHWHLAFPQVCHRSIVVSQGVFWDSPAGVLNRQNQVGREEWSNRLLYAVAAPARFVAQDRNTVNVIKATWPGYDHRLYYLPPGVDLNLFRQAQEEGSGGKIKVICPQDFGQEQGLSEILTLAGLMAGNEPEVEFHIVGRMREFSIALQLAKRIRTMPNCVFYWVPTAHLPRLYPRFDLALLPYRACTGASVHCLQAMACGLPVIAGLAGGLAELVVDGWNGRLVPPGSALVLGEAVRQLAADGDLRRRMGANSRLLAEGYPVETWKRRWKDLLEHVLSVPNPESGNPRPPQPGD